MQSKVCRANPTLTQSKDQRFYTRKNHAKKNGGSARSIWRSAGRPFSYQIYGAYTRGIALVSDCSRNSDVRCSTQSFAPKHKIQEVATTHIFLRNDGNNLLTHKLEET